MASLDKHTLPRGIWYDALRSHDDGSFSKVTTTNRP